MTAQRPAQAMLGPLRYPAFRWLATGRFVVFLGNAVAPIALAFAVLDLTGSLTDLGLVVAARALSNVAFMLVGGVLADRLPRQLVLQGSAAMGAVVQGIVAASLFGGFATVPLLIVLSALGGAVVAPALPAAAALTPQTVPPEELFRANALARLAVTSAMVAGAALGGTLVAVLGPAWGITVDALTFLLAAACFARVRVPGLDRSTTEPSNPLADLREGWTEFRRRTWVWAIVLQFMVVNAVIVGSISVIGPAVADATIGRQAWGIVLAAETAGFALGGVIALRSRRTLSLRFGVGLIAFEAIPLIVLAEAPRLLLLVPAMLISGLALQQFTIIWDVSLQEHVPADRLARVYSYDAVGSFVAIPVGQVLAGPLAEEFGVDGTLHGAAILLLVATLAVLSTPSVRAVRRVTTAKSTSAVPGETT